jgi:hypothetical protein
MYIKVDGGGEKYLGKKSNLKENKFFKDGDF